MVIKKVVLGSESDLKLRAVATALKSLGVHVEPVGYKTGSGVPVQPQGMEEITRGARYRMKAVQFMYSDTDLCVGIESGIVMHMSQHWHNVACVAVLECKNAKTALAYSAHFPIPAWAVNRALEEKTDLGRVFQNLSSGSEKDPMRWLSNGTILREHLISQAVQCALVEILCHENYQKR